MHHVINGQAILCIILGKIFPLPSVVTVFYITIISKFLYFGKHFFACLHCGNFFCIIMNIFLYFELFGKHFFTSPHCGHFLFFFNNNMLIIVMHIRNYFEKNFGNTVEKRRKIVLKYFILYCLIIVLIIPLFLSLKSRKLQKIEKTKKIKVN